MRRRVAPACFAVTLALLVPLLSGCSSDKPLPRDCVILISDALARAVPDAEPVSSNGYTDSVRCIWRTRDAESRPDAVALEVEVTRYSDAEYQHRQLLNHWYNDDQANVTYPVSGLGDIAYRYTAIIDDDVVIGVRARKANRLVRAKLTTRYPARDDYLRILGLNARYAVERVLAA